MSRQPYPTDLSARQWQLIASLIPAAQVGGRPRTVDGLDLAKLTPGAK